MADDKNWFKIPEPDKSLLKQLLFMRADNERIDTVRTFIEWPDQPTVELPRRKFKLSSLTNSINKYEVIERLGFYYTYIWEDFLLELLVTRTEIQEIHFDTLLINVSDNLFIQFCRKFKSITFKEVSFPLNLYSDKIFREISRHSTFLLGHSQLDYYRCKVDKVALTDNFLLALTDESMRKEFSIAYLYTKCTVNGVDYLMKSASIEGVNIISWNFGFMNKREEKRADKFMDRINKENGPYKVFRSNFENQYILYSVFHVDDLSTPCITFRVVQNEPAEWAIKQEKKSVHEKHI